MPSGPSQRRTFLQGEMELNLTPMMNLIAILIPCLLISIAFVELAVIKVAAPAMADAPPQPEPEAAPLALAVTVSSGGYLLETGVGLFAQDGAPGLFIPTVRRAVSCARYRGTVPPPRRENRDAPACSSDEARPFVVYDIAALAARLVELKALYPDERRVIVSAQRNLEFEAVTELLDVCRVYEGEDGQPRALFDEVVFRPTP